MSHAVDGGSKSPTETGKLWLFGPLTSIGSLCCGVRSRKDHSILNNGKTCDAAFCQNSLTTCCYYERMLLLSTPTAVAGVAFHRRLSVCLFFHTIAWITKLDTQMFHDKSWKPTYFGSKGQRSRLRVTTKQCRSESLHCCEFWLFLVIVLYSVQCFDST